MTTITKTTLAVALAAAGLALGAALPAAASVCPRCEVAPVALDREWTLPFYPVAAGAYAGRSAGEAPTADPATLDAMARDGARAYLRRVDRMVAARNLPDAEDRAKACEDMAALLAPDFVHVEGRRNVAPDGSGGFVTRTRSQVIAACQNPQVFQITGFLAYRIRAVATGPNDAVITTCYDHDQVNDPLVQPGGLLPDRRGAVQRVSVEIMRRNAEGVVQAVSHTALDSDAALVHGGCAVR